MALSMFMASPSLNQVQWKMSRGCVSQFVCKRAFQLLEIPGWKCDMDVTLSDTEPFRVRNCLLRVIEVTKVAAISFLIGEGHDWILARAHHQGCLSKFFTYRIER